MTEIFCLLFVPTETALERDYFMTGSFASSVVIEPLNRIMLAAQEALDFGIVDGILERRPKFDIEST